MKLAVLYLWTVLYAMLTSASVTLFCAMVNYRAVYDFPFKMLAFSYSVFNWFLVILFARQEAIVKFLPLITGLFWSSSILEYRKKILFGDAVNVIYMSDHFRVAAGMGIIMTLSIALILRFYKKWSGV